MMTAKKPKGSNNWGRWGDDDERGTVNLLTPDVVTAATAAVNQGKVLSLSLPIKGSTSSAVAETVPHICGRPLPQHFMSVDGADYEAGVKQPAGGRGIADDALMISAHGTSTHMDALCHMWTGDQIYNGHAASRIRSYGATRCGIEKVGGIATRGVFFNIPAERGLETLEATDRITVEDLQASCQRRGIQLRAGDAAVIRTGWTAVYAQDRDKYWSGEPGLSTEAAEWLAAQDIALVACDNSAISGLNADGRADESVEDDVHMIFLWRHGTYLVEMLWLEELATENPDTFLLVLAPLAIVGGTGSPVNPLAIL